MMETQQQLHCQRDVPLPENKVHLNPPAAAAAATSPSHDFSFTISIHNQSNSPTPPNPSPPAVDLSPADDIFFQGQLLPLRLLSHLPPRPPTDSSAHNHTKSIDQNTLNQTKIAHNSPTESNSNPKPKSKSKSHSFSLFKISPKSTKEVKSIPPDNGFGTGYKATVMKSKFEGVKRFLRSIRLKPGSMNLRGTRKGEHLSAPVTVWNSPKNSGILVGSGAVTPTKNRDSTMEELQAAIQAAIAHCKKSTAMEDKINPSSV